MAMLPLNLSEAVPNYMLLSLLVFFPLAARLCGKQLCALLCAGAAGTIPAGLPLAHLFWAGERHKKHKLQQQTCGLMDLRWQG